MKGIQHEMKLEFLRASNAAAAAAAAVSRDRGTCQNADELRNAEAKS